MKSLFFPVLLLLLFSKPFTGLAQIEEELYRTDYYINPEDEGKLRVEIDNVSFFRNNEFKGEFLKGYTLPGLRIEGKMVYNPLSNIKLEAGIFGLRYWGADKYPNYAYLNIAEWKGNKYTSGMHFLPYFRAQVALSKQVNIVLGNLYGGANHRLIEPLYFPELNLTADPEAGVQVLFDSRWIDVDAWMNWESFIFKGSEHQEAFTFGLSTRVKLNNPTSRYHFFVPLQGLAIHRGGEIDAYRGQVQTVMNGSAGVGMDWNTGYGLFKKLNAELHVVGHNQSAGTLLPLDNGRGFYAKAVADIHDFRIKSSYWSCHNFISMFGVPFYGAVSTLEDITFKDPKMFFFGAEYCRSFGKGFALGIDFDVYHQFSKTGITPNGPVEYSRETNVIFGIYLRVNPSFLLKTF